ncbi:MAG: sigma-70 family RNA polymerase sigma factor [Clostridia bacterium]|nr:sigma-70 family RNA polymerase sigma factor [Clostridia bacterium]
MKKIIENIKLITKKIKNWLYKIFKGDFLSPQNIVNYIFTAESLPEPLNTETEFELVKSFQEEDNLNAKSKLIEHNLRLVMYIAKKFESTKTELADLVSVGSIGLIKAVDSYKLDKNIKLATYASRCIENEILMYLRKINKSINDLSLDDSLVSDDEGSNLTLGEMIPDTKQVYEEIELKDQKSYLLQSITKLNHRERKIMCMRYGLAGYDELTQKEVADSMNISQSYISRLEKKILNKLKKDMTKNF